MTPRFSRILVVAAHPDDIDFSAAGTVALWTDAGIDVIYCLVTDGDAGGFDESCPGRTSRRCGARSRPRLPSWVGVHDLRFLGYPDGRVNPRLELRKDLARVIRQVRPDRLVCPSPERNYQRIGASHPDHRAVGIRRSTRSTPTHATRSRSLNCSPTRGSTAWTVREVWMAASPAADHYVDITETFPRKLAALRAHESQTGHMDGLEDFLRGWLTRAAGLGGLPEGRLAEAFQVLDTA